MLQMSIDAYNTNPIQEREDELEGVRALVKKTLNHVLTESKSPEKPAATPGLVTLPRSKAPTRLLPHNRPSRTFNSWAEEAESKYGKPASFSSDQTAVFEQAYRSTQQRLPNIDFGVSYPIPDEAWNLFE